MPFSPADISDILAETGEDVTVTLSGVTVKTIRAKFRKDFEAVSPYEASVGTLNPSFMCATADLVDVTNSHAYVIRGAEYRRDSKPQELPSGFSRVILVKK